MDNLHDLVEEAINITISTTGVDYNNDDDHEDDDAMPSLSVFEPPEFVCTPSNTIDIFGADHRGWNNPAELTFPSYF